MKLYQNILDSVTKGVSNARNKKIYLMDTYFPGGRTAQGGTYLSTVIVIVSVGAVISVMAKIITTIIFGM